MDTVRVDMRDVEKGMSALEKKQVPFAGVMALNATAQDVLTDLQQRMDVVFDRPTRFTKNAFMVWRANKSTMEAAVQERPSVGKRHYLKIQEVGGARGNTGMEGMLNGVLGGAVPFEAAIPAAGAKLDASGNWSKSERNKVLGALKGGATAMGNAAGVGYFVPKAGSRLGAGVYRRDRKGAINKIVTLARSLPVYSDRLGFQDGARDVVNEKLAANFEKAFAKAMASAR